MADPQGNVRFEGGEAIHRLVFGINALCVLEDEFGCSVAEIGQRLTPVELDAKGDPVIDGVTGLPRHKMPAMKDIRSIFRAGMIEHWSGAGEPSPEDAGRMITALGIANATELLGEAFAAAFPDAVVQTGKTAGNRLKK